VEKVFFPLDEELALLPGNLAPRQQEHLAHLASWMPFEKVAQMIEEILAVQTTAETVRRITERLGACMEVAQLAQNEVACPPESTEQPIPPRLAMSADGAMVSLIKKQWVEVRTVAIGEPQEKRTTKGETESHVGHLSSFSRFADAITFTNLAEKELQRRNVAQAGRVCAVMDGADWLQFFTDKHRPDALRILDFPTCQLNISTTCWRLWRKLVCIFHRRCSNGVCISSNIGVPVLSCAWLIVWQANLPTKRLDSSIWTICANERC
jgi:hypothetical protein